MGASEEVSINFFLLHIEIIPVAATKEEKDEKKKEMLHEKMLEETRFLVKILKFMQPIESVAGAIFTPDRNSVLLIKRRDVPVWVLPGGGVERNETPEEAVIREILEETGFTVECKRLVGAYTPINKLTKQTHIYECVILSGTPSICSETRGIDFFDLDALPKLIPPPYPEWITDAALIAPPLQKKLSSVTYFILIKNLFLHPILVIRFLLARLGLTINI